METLVELSVELTMELVSSLPLRSLDVYDPLQIFLQKIGSQEISLFMVQSAIRSVFIMNNSPLSAISDSLDLPSFTAGLSRSRKSVQPPSLWFSPDASVPFPDHHLGLIEHRDVIRPDCAYLPLTTTFIGDECFQAEENDGESNG